MARKPKSTPPNGMTQQADWWQKQTPQPAVIPRALQRDLEIASLDGIYGQIGVTIESFMLHIDRYYAYDPDLEDVHSTWRDLTFAQRRRLTFAELCHMAKYDASDMFAVLAKFVYDYQYAAAQRIVSLNLPAMVEESIAAALNGGDKERIQWLQSLGFLAAPKGAQTIVQVNAHANATAAAAAAGLPAFEDTINMAAEDIRAVLPTNQLPAFTSDIIDLPVNDSMEDYESISAGTKEPTA